jgi:hypothetical protein
MRYLICTYQNYLLDYRAWRACGTKRRHAARLALRGLAW